MLEVVAPEHKNTDCAVRPGFYRSAVDGVGEFFEAASECGRGVISLDQSHGWSVGVLSSVDGLADLSGISTDESTGDVADRLWTAKRGCELEVGSETEPIVELGHDRDVGACETIDSRVIAHDEQVPARLSDEFLDEPSSGTAGVLKLVHKYKVVVGLQIT